MNYDDIKIPLKSSQLDESCYEDTLQSYEDNILPKFIGNEQTM